MSKTKENKTEKNILIAFILNLCFSAFELVGGFFTGSVAILSDSVHDLGDALSIGVSWWCEKKSQKKPDTVYTYGFSRYSVLGSVITTAVLLVGSVLVIINAVRRIITPEEIRYDSMIVFAVIGVIVNAAAAFFTKEGDSLNQKAVNLHMLEDVLGWVVVLIGAVIMRFTDISLLDPLMSIGVAIFILIGTVKNLDEILDVFLEKMPHGLEAGELVAHLSEIDGVAGVHHLHVWSMDGQNHYATVHVVTDADAAVIKAAVRQELAEHGICHVTVETERTDETCACETCAAPVHTGGGHHHHHHH